jgi:hypothetical protein
VTLIPRMHVVAITALEALANLVFDPGELTY